MIIAIAGIKRSGSTVMFNLVRLALEMAGYTVNICGHGYKPRTVPEGEVDLVKRHPFSKAIAEKADHIFLTDRPSRDIQESMARFSGRRPCQRKMNMMRKHLVFWKDYTDEAHLFEYEMLKNNLKGYIRNVLSALELTDTVGYETVLVKFNKIQPPESGQDPKTLLFHNHITQ